MSMSPISPSGPKFKRRIKAVVACGNGTAGAFAPGILEALGVDVVPLDTELDHTFPNYNPNPEDMKMLHAMAAAVKASGADVGLGFDGDGDRCGIVDNEGQEIFADKIGVMLARDLSKRHPERAVRRRRQVDRPLRDRSGAASRKVPRPTTARPAIPTSSGASRSSRRWRASRSPAISSSTRPIGRGYDDGVVTAIAVLDMLDRNPGRVDGRSLSRSAQDLGLADHVGAIAPMR